MAIKIVLTIFGIVLILFTSLFSGLVCKQHPKALWLFCVIDALLGCAIVLVW